MFAPDWTSPPGDTIADLLTERQIPVDELADRLALSIKNVNELLDGKHEISDELAGKLQINLGSTARFWRSREKQYRESILTPEARLDAFARALPMRDMLRFGWLDRFRREDGEVAAALRFFGINSPRDFSAKYEELEVALAFRKSASFELKPFSLAAWFRAAEIQTEEYESANWNRAEFIDCLVEIRKLSRERNPDSFLPKLRDICKKVGVVLAVVPTPAGCPVSGATFFSTPERANILLSFRYLTDDQFWFSFFHEAGHLVLHDKKDFFVESEKASTDAREQEANDFAASILVPTELQADLKSVALTKYDIVRFARLIGVSPGIVVGQLQHLGRVRRNQFNFLKRKYDLTAILERQ